MIHRLLPPIFFVGLMSSLMIVRAQPAIVVVDISEFHADHVLRGRRAAEDDIKVGKPGFYLGICSFPSPSKNDNRKLDRQKKMLAELSVTPKEYDKCNDVMPEANRFAAFVEGYNEVSSA